MHGCDPGEPSSGVLNIVSDVEALLIPAWAIWQLSMPI